LIYIDSSVALAYLLAEPRSPSTNFWQQELTSSALLEYELWNRVNALGKSASLVNELRALVNRIGIVEMDRSSLMRALEPWPISVRTLDGLHLATMDFLGRQGRAIELASYDRRMIAAAKALGFPIAAF
jgi:predicted nucleic acid-binding protein